MTILNHQLLTSNHDDQPKLSTLFMIHSPGSSIRTQVGAFLTDLSQRTGSLEVDELVSWWWGSVQCMDHGGSQLADITVMLIHYHPYIIQYPFYTVWIMVYHWHCDKPLTYSWYRWCCLLIRYFGPPCSAVQRTLWGWGKKPLLLIDYIWMVSIGQCLTMNWWAL